MARRFQRLRRPPLGSHPWWSFLNTSFGLWVLSALFITTGGAFISTRSECIREAESDIQLIHRLSSEIFSRRLRIIAAAQETSNSIDFLKIAKSTAFANFKEFDGQSMFSLVAQESAVRLHIKNDPLTGKKRSLLEMMNAIDLFIDGSAFNIDIPERFIDREFESFRPRSNQVMMTYQKQQDSGRGYVPACSIPDLLERLVTYTSTTVEYVGFKVSPEDKVRFKGLIK
jgi:hypothetical protein